MLSKSEEPSVSLAIRRVLAGDENGYELIYKAHDRPLRAFIGARYGRYGSDFVAEVAARTHAYAASNLDKFDPARSSFQTWLNLRSLNPAGQVRLEWYGLRRVVGPDGKRRTEPRLVTFEEDVHAQYVPAQPGPEEAREREERNRVLWQEYESLAEQGRLSIAGHDLEGLTFTQTAHRLGIGVSRVRRERERAKTILERRLQERGIGPCERESTAAPIIRAYGQSLGEDDEWCASVTANPPDRPDVLVGAAAKDERKEEEPDE